MGSDVCTNSLRKTLACGCVTIRNTFYGEPDRLLIVACCSTHAVDAAASVKRLADIANRTTIIVDGVSVRTAV